MPLVLLESLKSRKSRRDWNVFLLERLPCLRRCPLFSDGLEGILDSPGEFEEGIERVRRLLHNLAVLQRATKQREFWGRLMFWDAKSEARLQENIGAASSSRLIVSKSYPLFLGCLRAELTTESQAFQNDLARVSVCFGRFFSSCDCSTLEEVKYLLPFYRYACYDCARCNPRHFCGVLQQENYSREQIAEFLIALGFSYHEALEHVRCAIIASQAAS